ncbi:MAG: alpha/beta fold hydrolase [Sciscionella sp.]
MANLQYTLQSGRRLGVTAMGRPGSRRVIVFCHSAPGSSLFDPDPYVSSSRDVHILAFDRPGYGSSDPLPDGQWPTVGQAADDIGEYLRASENTAHGLDRHEFDSVGAVGWSAGGTVALALAAQHPDLVDRVAVVGTPAPDDKVPWIDPELAEVTDRLAKESPDAAIEQLVDIFRTQLADRLPSQDPEDPAPLDLLKPCGADEDALDRPGVRQRLGVMLRDAFRQGPVGVASDILGYVTQPRAFDFSDVHAKTLVVYGEADAVAGRKHAVWYRRHIDDVRVEMVPNVGHLAIIPAWDRLLAFLAPGTKPRL